MRKRLKSRKDVVVTTVALPPELYERLGMAAVQERVAAAEIIRVGLEEWLDRRDGAGKRKGKA